MSVSLRACKPVRASPPQLPCVESLARVASRLYQTARLETAIAVNETQLRQDNAVVH
jgi:hypothetical protein